MMKRFFFTLAIALALGLAAIQAPAISAELRIGLSAAPTSMDPQFYVVGQNSAMARNIFDGLVNQDEKQQLKPALALSWKPIDDTTWEFKLRPGVKFHDGTDFDAADVIASIERVSLAAKNSPSSFVPYVKDIVEMTAPDPLTVRIKTSKATPLLVNNLSRIAILPSEAKELSTSDLNAGKGVIGTGPFKFVSWTLDDNVVLARNDAYWGKPAAWDKVTFRVLKNPGARIAASLSGDVDIIENVPTENVKQLESNKALKVVSVASNRVMYLHMDQDRDTAPFAADANGKNPLVKAEVRRAISLALDRKALVDRIMDGQGTPAGQLVPEGYFGYSPAIKVDPFDPAKAKDMLTKAGYPDGFKLTFHASNDRYPNDAKVAQAVAQMIAKLGIKIDVLTMPGGIYFSRASAREFSFIMGGAAVETGESSSVLGPLLATFSSSTGQGNRGRYSSPDFDKALNEALATVNDAKREVLLQHAMEIGMKDLGVIPLFFLANTWAMKSNLVYTGRSDGYTLAYDVNAAK
jgi:peptide/nickel transport system substrate-binding protein